MRWIVALLFVLSSAATAQAGWLNSLGRHLGLGWSDGYHSCDQCPPRSASSFAIPPGGLVPQGPFVVPEPQPTPAQPRLEPLPAPRTTARGPAPSAVPYPLIEMPR